MKKQPKKSFTINFPKWIKGRGFVQNRLDKSSILINGLFLVCVLLSISSGLIDIIFFSGLSKEKLPFGPWMIAAAILYTAMSIGFTFGKFFCAMMLGMLKELRSRLRAALKPWAENISKAIIPWQIVHKFLIGISILTSISLSVVSIGNGVRLMEQNIKNMTADADELISLNQSVNENIVNRRDATQENISGTRRAQQVAQQEVDDAWNRIAAYQSELDKIDDNDELTDEEKTQQKADLKRAVVSRTPKGVTNANVDYMTKTQLRTIMQQQTLANEVIDATSSYDESIKYDKEQIETKILAIADKEYKTPNGNLIKFVNDDGTTINIQLAISRLQSAISLWQSDTGETGASSKVFTLIATYIHAAPSAGGMGVSEIMLMIVIMIFGIVQEFLIALFTPKSNIDRKLLSQVSQYLEWKDEREKETFLISVYTDYVGDGIINQADYEAKCRKCVELMENTQEDIIAKYSKVKKENPEVVELKNKIEKLELENKKLQEQEKKIVEQPKSRVIKTDGYSDAVADKIKEIEAL